MPTFEVRLTAPTFVSVTLQADDEMQARWEAAETLCQWAGTLTAGDFEAKRQPPAPDDNGDARSEARYTETDTDAETERRADHRWGLGASESPAEGTET